MRLGKGKKEHLFFNCRFGNQVWRRIGVVWVSGIDITYMFEHAKKSFQGPKFMEVAISLVGTGPPVPARKGL
jgi:hypothetical protein